MKCSLTGLVRSENFALSKALSHCVIVFCLFSKCSLFHLIMDYLIRLGCLVFKVVLLMMKDVLLLLWVFVVLDCLV